ncbi:hypothetical protein [Roseospirillum parvum]|uniref:Uncharacterized protein n=1 Tax=Roseospirillum parvum TaxID=83401 RepID=A0A1G8F2E8_9PROT|nr:hypothetical protein [Roseospirillum parvum]SDH76333.1 hypothetical protein SAMN05421742_1126 [Roseospirillum parvum]
MHSEYAVDPEAIGSSWENFRFLIDKFGFDKGRLISRFPGKWEKKVIEAAKEAGVRDVKIQSIVDRLKNGKKARIVDFQRDFEHGESWIKNALREHRARPFHAIVSLNTQEACTVLLRVDDCEDDHTLFCAPISRNVRRTIQDIAVHLNLLVAASKEINIVDPYFDIRGIGGDYRGFLDQLFAICQNYNFTPRRIRVHFGHHDSRPPDHMLRADAERRLNGHLPTDIELELNEWAEKPGGEDFHDRYILSECAGIMVGAGLSPAGANETATFTLLDDTHAQALRARFAPDAEVYTKIGRSVLVRPDGSATLI